MMFLVWTEYLEFAPICPDASALVADRDMI